MCTPRWPITVRDYLVDRWQRTVAAYVENSPKFVYYLSAEYLPGRQITQNLLYTDTIDLARQALAELGYDLDQIVELEPEPALGNGGLGRLAACYLDSLATLDIPSVAYGIHYEYGIFKQSIRDGWQTESPDDWLYYGNPWEFPQPDNLAHVGFGGHTEVVHDRAGRLSRPLGFPPKRSWANRATFWCPAMKPARSICCACGARAPARN